MTNLGSSWVHVQENGNIYEQVTRGMETLTGNLRGSKFPIPSVSGTSLIWVGVGVQRCAVEADGVAGLFGREGPLLAGRDESGMWCVERRAGVLVEDRRSGLQRQFDLAQAVSLPRPMVVVCRRDDAISRRWESD